MAYDYITAVREDVKQWIIDNADYIRENFDLEDEDAIREYLNDTLWIEDSVTGNASGSYTFNRAEAEVYVKDNLDLAVEAMREFGDLEKLGEKIEAEEWEFLDVTIRCYLLGDAIQYNIDTLTDDDVAV